jgi:hypothetical protein
MTVLSVGAELFQLDKQTDVTNLIFVNFANALSNNLSSFILSIFDA